MASRNGNGANPPEAIDDGPPRKRQAVVSAHKGTRDDKFLEAAMQLRAAGRAAVLALGQTCALK